MGARPADYVVLLTPPATVGAACEVVLLSGEPEAFLPLILVLQPLTVLGIVVGLVQLTRSTRGPSTFKLTVYRGEPAFAALPAFRRQCVFNGLLSAALLLMALNGMRVAGRIVPTMAWAILVVNGCTVLLLLFRMIRSGPLLLTRDGIAVDGGRSFVPWAALGPGPEHQLWTVTHPELIEGARVKRFQPGQDVPLDVSLWFLFRAIHTYVEHPQQRLDIGTPEELVRLRGTLARQAT
ncbi:hypothetical protein ACQP1P_03635 [Dactylosporangium sp. CA-052675]|uniref:hypothetical protein n=1 Tax=Dactylosporangium sp. CA-052675 TaxID=3239927 RepID=UPI003D936ED4